MQLLITCSPKLDKIFKSSVVELTRIYRQLCIREIYDGIYYSVRSLKQFCLLLFLS